MSPLKGRIRNILIFVSDSLRFDYYPKELEEYGLVIKCIAQSIFTPVSMASIVTGLNPPRHMIKDFFDIIPSNIPTMFDLPVNVSYWDHPHDPLYKVLRQPPRIPLEKLNEPFIYVERTGETHVPYDPQYKDRPDGFGEYVKVVRRNKKKLVSDYREAIERAFNIFLQRLQVLKRRGILDRTLVIFLSDHGEILTEYGGFLFHNFPPCPETVYVPLALIHPDLGGGLVKDLVVRQVDVFPTVLQVLGLELPIPVEGLSILDILSQNIQLYGFNWYRRYRFKITTLSIWDRDGNGTVLIDAPIYVRLLDALADMLRYTHSLHPLKLHRKVLKFGKGIENGLQLIEIFRHFPTYGIKDNIFLSPLTKEWTSVYVKVKLAWKLRQIRKRIEEGAQR